jgi:hypothetical protein
MMRARSPCSASLFLRYVLSTHVPAPFPLFMFLDHLSALATLSANVGNGKAFVLGIQWGIGHSTGLLTVALILVLTTDGGDKLDVSPFVSRLLESFVGVFMLALGSITMAQAFRKRRIYNEILDAEATLAQQSVKTSTLEETACLCSGENKKTNLSSNAKAVLSQDSYQHRNGVKHAHITDDGGELVLAQMMHTSDPKNSMMHNILLCLFLPHDHVEVEEGNGSERSLMMHTHDDEAKNVVYCFQTCLRKSFPCCCSGLELKLDTNTFSGKIVAFAAGIIHGLAGPGGILGVIPAMHMRNWQLACLYLSCFCVSSTTVMGIFATLYGNISKALSAAGNADFYMEIFSSSLSVIVGVLWLTLLSIGKLDEIFD